MYLPTLNLSITAAAAGPSSAIYKNTIPESTVSGVAALSIETSESLPFKSASDRHVPIFCCIQFDFISFFPLSVSITKIFIKGIFFRFKSLFASCKDEKLVSYYSCSWWKGRLPSRGWMYLTENNLAFYSYTLGKEAKLLLRWTDVTKVEKTNNYVRPDSIRVATRESEYV